MNYVDHYGNTICEGEYIYFIGPAHDAYGRGKMVPYDMNNYNPRKTSIYPIFVYAGELQTYLREINDCNFLQDFPPIGSKRKFYIDDRPSW